MDVSRRSFLKLSGGTLLLGSLSVNLDPAKAYARALRVKDARETLTICPYCAVGCGLIVYSREGKVVNTEGNPDHPINEGTLCSKGASLSQLVNNPLRLTKPRYRAPGAKEWRDVEWDWALNEIAKRVKKARDNTFVMRNADGKTVNRSEGIAHVGSAALDNEECYILQKLLRSWGLVYIEHQARI
jgi:formate dehydrogenase major subunit